MSGAASAGTSPAGWNGLTTLERTLPASFYLDPAHHALELERVWYRNWIYLCRTALLAQPLDYRTFEIGTQQILLLRDEAGVLRAFHNTCRHRGSTLCPESEGRLRGKFLTCPYHSWTYDLRGTLLSAPSPSRRPAFDCGDFPLYDIAVQEWNGLVFVNLAAEPKPFGQNLDVPLDRLDHWPLAELVSGHSYVKRMRCNWKIFWENYNECLHCPQVHPELCNVVPIYSRAIMDEHDDPNWQAHATGDDPRHKGGLRTGAETWSMDGKGLGAGFAALTEAERKAGYLFVTSLPSLYIVAHVDYVRVVRLRPLGPEETELTAEWLFPKETLATASAEEIASTVEFAKLVMSQDAGVCELNQGGLRSIRHESGVLMPEEYAIHQFHDWIRSELARP